MLRILDARTAKGRRDLEGILSKRRGAPDFETLREILPVVEEVLRKGPKPLARFVRRFDGVSLPVGTITVVAPGGAVMLVSGVFTYRANEAGKLAALRAYWELGEMKVFPPLG